MSEFFAGYNATCFVYGVVIGLLIAALAVYLTLPHCAPKATTIAKPVEFSIKEFIGDGLILSFGVILAFIFYPVAVYGSFYAREPSPVILWTEIALIPFAIYIGIDRLIDDLKNMLKPK